MPQCTIRIYGIWINDNYEVLLSDERIGDTIFTKFPGGGMEKNEGTIDCLKREWQEELNTDIEVLSHYYTTDFYQASAFHTNTQVISIYYLVQPIVSPTISFSALKNNFSYNGEREESFRFRALNDLKEEDLTFPIDKYVAGLIKKGRKDFLA